MEIAFSILGSGRVIKYFKVDSPLYKLIGHLNSLEIRNALYSEQFQSFNLKLKSGKLASTFFEVIPDQQIIAYDLDRVTRLELKIKNKSRNKIFFQEILSEELLFPLYNYKISDLLSKFDKGLVVIENDIGHFGRCKLDTENFDVDKLSFDLIEDKVLMKSFVLKIYYEGNELSFRKRDSLFNGNVLVIKQY